MLRYEEQQREEEKDSKGAEHGENTIRIEKVRVREEKKAKGREVRCRSSRISREEHLFDDAGNRFIELKEKKRKEILRFPFCYDFLIR